MAPPSIRSAPQVTIAIPSRNRAQLLGLTLQSILAQSVPLEVLVVRTAGDRVVPTVPEVNDPRVTVLACPESSRGAAGYNVALEHVRTPWLVFWDDDDLMFPESLRSLLQIAENTDFKSIAGARIKVKADAIYEDLKAPVDARGISIRRVAFRDALVPFPVFPNHAHSIYRTECLSGIRWRPELGVVPLDAYFGLEALSACQPVGLTSIPFRAYRQHHGQVSRMFAPETDLQMFHDLVEWSLRTFPEVNDRSLQHALKAREHYLQASVSFASTRPLPMLKHVLTGATLYPKSLAKAEWWKMIAAACALAFHFRTESR